MKNVFAILRGGAAPPHGQRPVLAAYGRNRHNRGFLPALFMVIGMLLFHSNNMRAQSECPNILDFDDCIYPVQHPNESFKCIDATIQGQEDIHYWINVGMMSTYVASGQTPQFLIIRGFLTISPDQGGVLGEYTFAPGSEIIFVDNSSGIEVLTGATLSLVNTYVHGCESMWNYIRANQNACVKAVGIQGGNTVIEDGRIGLWGWGNGSRIRATDCIFRRNRVSILFGEPLFPQPTNAYSDGISGDTFWGDEMLLSNTWGFEKSALAIGIYQIKNTIKVGEKSGNRNVFRDFHFNDAISVLAYNSNILVENSQFFRTPTASSPLPGNQTAVFAQSTTGAHIATIRGLDDEFAEPTFTGFRRAVWVYSQNLNLKGTYFGFNRSSVVQTYFEYDPPLLILPISCEITDNKFENYDNSAISVSSVSDANLNLFPLVLKNMNISNNEFYDGYLNNPAMPRFAIEVSSGIGGTTNYGYIGNNTVNILPKSPENHLKGGISLTRMNNFVLEQNIVNDYDNQYNQGSQFQGISLNACKATKLLGNGITGNAQTLANDYMTGIANVDSDNSYFNCNYLDGAYRGLFFDAPGTNYATLCFNHFNQHTFGGLHVDFDAKLGDQVAGENRWEGTNSFYEAYQEWDIATYGLYDPHEVNHQNVVKSHGEFKINSPGDQDVNDPYWPAPRAVSLESDEGVWFTKIPGGEPSPEEHCIGISDPGPGENPGAWLLPPDETEKTLTKGDQLLIANTYPQGRGEGWEWEARFQFFGRLTDFPELRPASSAAAAWYANQENTALGQLYGIYTGVDQVSSLSESEYQPMQANYYALELLIGQAGDLGTALHQATTPAEVADLYAQREVNTAAIITKMAAYDSLLVDFSTDASAQANTLLNTLNAITAVDRCDISMKTVLATQLELILAGTGLTPQQSLTLEAIAGQCRYEGGWAVALARIMLPGEEYDDEELCEAGEQLASNSDQHREESLRVAPNPAHDLVEIQVNGVFSAGAGRVFNARGEMVHSWVFSENKQQLRTLKLPPGIYWLSVTLDDKRLPAQKLTIIP